MSENDEPTIPTDVRAKPKRAVPPQLRPGFRTPEQQARLVEADQAAWASLARFRFASPLALRQMHYSPKKLGFDIGEHAFKGRAQRHVAKGYWASHRLGSRPETVVSLTKRGMELVESTYGLPVPAWNVDSARRGWLRSLAWASLTTAGSSIETGVENLKNYRRLLPEIEARAMAELKAHRVPATDAFVALVKKLDAAEGETPPAATYDYVRKGAERAFLLVEDPHKSVESQIEALKAVKDGLGRTNMVIYRPVDELSAWSPTQNEWVRRSGRLGKALSLLRAAGFVLDVAQLGQHVLHMQTNET